jgi:nitroreductase
MLRELVLKNRSYRRFYEEARIETSTLTELVDLARFCASVRNRQALKFILSNNPEKNVIIFSHLNIDGHPVEGERPAAYIIILGDTTISKAFGADHGIVAQTILLAATEMGLGGCMVGNMNRVGLRQALGIPERYEILLSVVLGRPKEVVVTEPLVENGRVESWVDEKRVRRVPKRSLGELIIAQY